MSRFVVDAPVVIRLVEEKLSVYPENQLLAPALLRSQVPSALLAAVRRGTLDVDAARDTLDGVRALPVRLLGDRVLQMTAWSIALDLGWEDTYRAEYLALTRLQGDAIVTKDPELAVAADRLGMRVATIVEMLARR